MTNPRVLVVTRRTTRKHKYIDYVGEYHLELLIRLRMLPVLIPVVEGTLRCHPQYTRGLRGLLVVEGEDVEPKRFKSQPANFQYLEKTHPLKDQIEIRLIRSALSRGIWMTAGLLAAGVGYAVPGPAHTSRKPKLTSRRAESR